MLLWIFPEMGLVQVLFYGCLDIDIMLLWIFPERGWSRFYFMDVFIYVHPQSGYTGRWTGPKSERY